jgi:oligosaccharide repeat unit polymerase
MILTLLFLALIPLLFFAYFRFNNDLLSPAVIHIAVYMFSIFIAILNITIWHVDIRPWTAFVIFTGLFVFLLGSMVAIAGDKRNAMKVHKPSRELLAVPIVFYYITIFFISGSALIYYYYINQVAEVSSVSGATDTLLQAYRDAMVYGGVVEPIYITLMNLISGSIALFYLMIYANNFTLGDRRLKYLIPVLLSCITLVISSNRIEFIYIAVAAIICFYLAHVRIKGKTNNAKLVAVLCGVIIAFFGIFLLLGNLTGKTQQQDSVVQNIAIYSGSSVVAFDDYLMPRRGDAVEPGSETLYGIANIAKRLGFDMGGDKSRFLEQRYIGDMSVRTNIYTSLRRLVHDYGYVGMYIVQFVAGFLISTLYLSIRRNYFKNIYLATLIYVFLIQAIVVSFIEEKLIVNLFTFSTLVTFLMYFVLTRYFMKKRNPVNVGKS